MAEHRSTRQTPLGPVPGDWAVTKLGPLCSLVGGYAFKSERFTRTGVAIVRISDIAKESVNLKSTAKYPVSEFVPEKFTIEPGAILIAMSGATTGKVGRFEGNVRAYQNQRVGKFATLQPGLLDSDFLFQFVRSDLFKSQLTKELEQGAQPNVSSRQIESFWLRRPPLPEQRAIAEALGDVDALIAAQEKLIAKKRAIKTATMQRLLTGKQRLPGFGEGCGTKQTEIGVIPADWRSGNLQGRIELRSGQHILAKDYNSSREGVPYLTGPSDFHDEQTSEISKWTTNPKVMAYRGESLLTVKGSGAGSVFKIDLEKAAISRQLMALSALAGVMCDRFLFYLIKQAERRLAVKALGNLIPGLSRSDVLSCLFPLPAVSEQTAIARVLADMDSEILALEKRLAKTKAIKQGMMQELLTGRTRLV